MRRYENPEFHEMYRDGKTYVQIAEHFGVSVRSVEDWIKTALHTGLLERRKKLRSPLCGVRAVSPEVIDTVRKMRSERALSAEIATVIGKSLNAVYAICIKYGIRRPALCPRTIKPDQIEAVKELFNSGISQSEISKKTGVSLSSVSRILKGLGLRTVGENLPQPPRLMNPEKEAEMLKLWGEKFGPTEIARRLGVSRSTIEARATRLRLPRLGKELRQNRDYSHLHTPQVRAKAALTRRGQLPVRPQKIAVVVPVDIIPDGARPWLTRLRGECSYPYGPRGQIHSCCAPTWNGTTYCESHAGLCFEVRKAA